ncbi:MAG TPA: PadR family transcriptional regulator [Verrucomicrobiae bacterium]|nr:PadR family transcriptional regulator [Verrucomicrobiae bacterium]
MTHLLRQQPPLQECSRMLSGLVRVTMPAVHGDFFGIIEQMGGRSCLGEFELLVMLTILRLGEDAYGVPISREIEQRTGRSVTFGTVYATLERLQKKGFVRSNLGEATPERGGRAKRFFRVTSAGLRTVRETKRNLVRLWQGLPELEGGLA